MYYKIAVHVQYERYSKCIRKMHLLKSADWHERNQAETVRTVRIVFVAVILILLLLSVVAV